MNRTTHIATFVLIALSFGGCAANYVTPGGGVSLAAINDGDIADAFARQPASPFPANLAVIRVQDQGYVSRGYRGHSLGRFSVVTARDIESDDAMTTLGQLPLVAGVAPIGRLLLPSTADSTKELRLAAAQLQADLLLVYSVDTTFTVDGTALGPLSLISLGLIPNKQAHVTATVAGIVVDVRTGFVYGTAEASSTEHQRTTMWATQDATEAARIRAESAAFDGFVGELQGFWTNMVNVHAARPAGPALQKPAGERYYTTQID